MYDLFLPYLAATVATSIAVVSAVLAYWRFDREFRHYKSLEENLPDACRLQNVTALREQTEKELDGLRESLSDARLLLAQKQDAQKWLTENRQQLVAVEAEREEQERIRLELNRLNEQLQRDGESVRELTKELQTAQINSEFLRKQEQQLKDEIRSLRSQRESLTAQIHELERQRAPLDAELAGLRQRIISAEKSLEDTQQRLERALGSHDQQIKQLESQRNTAREELQLVQQELKAAEKEFAEVRGKHTALAAEIRGLEEQRLSLTEQLKTLRDDWQYLRVKTGQDEETERLRTSELWQPVIAQSATSFPSARQDDEVAALDIAHSYLKSLGLQFPQRVLWAFHTSLKVTDISPLVVLAGISGTGKSELPRRYAEAIGMHFLNVAVQPRWDSPQDMFGFFNYLENRYRATELGRALIQMDPCYAEKERGWRAPKNWEEHSLAQHLMIVLLDEMNLARVEYYFSEFLSRLEIRRGVNTKNSQDRRKAEIGLEIGAQGNHSPIMNVFVDRNVLFVGTMNEDETTQTLSDKVVDRANVLRFGRPGRLDRSSLNGNSRVRNERLAYSVWQNWCRTEKDLDSDISQRVDQWTQQLNDALTRIRRPFAYRTLLAMRAYVANYPARDEDGIAKAMADQVEQKIFPKFRGLDPRDNEVRRSLNEVRGVLEQLHDELLVKAIDGTLKDHQFVFMGVDRQQEEQLDSVST